MKSLLVLFCLLGCLAVQAQEIGRTPNAATLEAQQQYETERDLKQLEKLASRLDQALRYPKTTTVSSLDLEVTTLMKKVIEATGNNGLKEFLLLYQRTGFRELAADGNAFKAVDLTERFVEWARR